MNPKIKGLRTAIYHVADLDAAKKWYSDAFATQPYFDEPFYVGFNIGGYELGLQPEANPVSTKTENVVAYWGVDDVPASVAHFTALGATSHEPVTDVGGGIVVASVKDPWGNVVGLIDNPGFEVEE